MHWEKQIQVGVVVRRAITWKRLAISWLYRMWRLPSLSSISYPWRLCCEKEVPIAGDIFRFYKNKGFLLLLTGEFLFNIRCGSHLINQKFKMNGADSLHLSFVVLDVLSPCLAFNSNKNALWKEKYKKWKKCLYSIITKCKVKVIVLRTDLAYSLVPSNVPSLLGIYSPFDYWRGNSMLEFLDMENTLFRQYFQHRQDFPLHNLAKPCGLHDPHDLSPIS